MALLSSLIVIMDKMFSHLPAVFNNKQFLKEPCLLCASCGTTSITVSDYVDKTED